MDPFTNTLFLFFGRHRDRIKALPDNAKCEWYFTPETDGLSQEWNGTVWCNPPYGWEIGRQVKKAAESTCMVVMLLPARTDTKWFHDYVYKKAEIRFIRGRLSFENAKKAAPFHSMVMVFKKS